MVAQIVFVHGLNALSQWTNLLNGRIIVGVVQYHRLHPTLIGTPPNIIISNILEEKTGAGFGFFDFSYVGIVITLVGILFIAFIGKKLIHNN